MLALGEERTKEISNVAIFAVSLHLPPRAASELGERAARERGH